MLVERRYVVFMILVALILGGQIALRAYLAPKRPAVNNEQAEAPPDDAEKAKAEQDKTAGEKAAKKPAAEKVAGQPPQDEKPLPPEAAVAPPLRKAPRQQITLGSLDPNSGYTMLVTLDSRGAALARVELSNPKYRELDFTVGYLGQLALEDAADGCLVQVVGDGAPAALAIEMSGQVSGGLQPGDVIQSIGGMATPDTRALENFLAKKGKPGETVELAVSRKPTKEKGKEEESLHLKFSTKLTRAPLQIIQPETHGDAEHPDPLSLLLTLDNVMGKTIKMSEGGREIRGLPSLRDADRRTV